MANLLDWFKKRTEDVFGGIGNAINQAIGATGNQAQGVANNIRNVVATQPRNIQQASQNVFRGINDQYNRTALAQTPDILADTLKNIQEITRPLNDMGKDMVAKQYGIDRNQLEQIIKQPLGDRAKFAVNRPLELNKQNPMMGIMGSPLNPTNAAFNAYNNSPVPIPKVDTTDLVNDASDLYVKSGLADPVTGWIGENIVKPTAMNVARYADVTQGQQKYSEGLKGLAEGGTDAFGIASLLYTPAKAGQLALGGKAALRVAPSAALRGAGAGAGISTLNQYADTGRINPTDVALSGLLGGVANVALPVAGGYAGRGLQRAGTAVKPVARELRLDTGGFAKLPGKNNPIDPLESLKAEARKYKSAEEFVKAQGEPIYHRSPNKFNEFDISRVSNDSNRQRYGWGLNFSDTVPHNQYGDNLYEARISKDALIDLQNPVKEDVVSRIVDAVKKNGKNPSELNEFSYNGYLFYKTLSRILGGDKDASLFLSKNGIDGLTHSIGKNANDYVLFNNASIKTKQQLTDLYNQANAPVGKYKTVHQGGKSVQVDGEPIKIADGLDTFIHKDENGNWVVSEATTGRSLTGGGYENKTFAIKAARDVVMTNGVDNVKKRVAEVAPQVGKTDPLEALKAEARKYKSAEEFIGKDNTQLADLPNYKFDINQAQKDFSTIQNLQKAITTDMPDATPAQRRKVYIDTINAVNKKYGTNMSTDINDILDVTRNANKYPNELAYESGRKAKTDLYNQAHTQPPTPNVEAPQPTVAPTAALKQYGWSSKQDADGTHLFNANGKHVATIKQGKNGRLTSYYNDGEKMGSAGGSIDQYAEKIATQQFYAKKIEATPQNTGGTLRPDMKPIPTTDANKAMTADTDAAYKKQVDQRFAEADKRTKEMMAEMKWQKAREKFNTAEEYHLSEVDRLYKKYKNKTGYADSDMHRLKRRIINDHFDELDPETQVYFEHMAPGTDFENISKPSYRGFADASGGSGTEGVHASQIYELEQVVDEIRSADLYNQATAPQVGKTNASGNFSKGEKVGFAGILSPQGKERTGTFVRQVDKYLAEIDYGDHTELNHVNNLYKLDDSTPPAQVGKTGGNLPPKTPPTKPGTPELPNVPKKSPKTTEVKLNTDRLDLSKTQKARVDKNTAATVKRMSNAEVEKLAKSAGIDTKQKGFNETRKEIAEQLNTRRKAVQLEKQADRARRSGDTEKAKALLKKAATLEKTSRTQGTAAGRNLQARKIIANELNSPQQKVFKLLDEAGVDVDKYVDRFADVDFSNSTEVAKAYRELVPATAEEWLDKYRYTNMLSSPLTHLVNISSNLTGTLGVSPIRKIYEGGVDATRNAVTRSGRTRYAGEGAVQFKESLKNIPAAVKEFKDVWTGKVDMTNPDFENTAITSRLAVGGKKGAIDSVLSFIPRLLEASDRFSMNMTEAGELGSLKYRQGKGIKVTDMASKAKENATYTAFRQELNKNGQGHILGAIDWVPTILKQGREAKNPIIRNASKIAFPFVNTPTNLFKQGIEYSPLGVTTLWGNSNKTAQSAKMLMGTTATALIGGTLAANDALTFAEPSNAKERDAFRAEGKQAYSFKIGDKWISYSKMHPAIAFNFAITAAVKDAMDKGTIDQSASDKIMSAAGGMMGYLTDQSYMKNIGDLVSVFQSKDGSSIGDSISSEGMNTINQLVPFRSMVSWIGRQIDPTQRKVDYSANVMEQIYQGIVKDIPGLNSGVPTRKNPYTGQDIKSDFPLLNSWNPYRVTQDMGYGNTTGMNVEQRQMQKGLPETERAGFRAGVMQQKGLERLADKEKEQLKSAEGQTKTLSNGKVYAKVGDKYETFDSQEKADVAIFKDEFKKSDKKSAVKGDTYFYKKKNGDVVTKPKALYDWEQTDARANLEMDRAYEAKDIDTWAKAAQTKLDGLEKKKSLYDPETEQDEIDKITLQQENLLQKAAKYLSKGMGGSGGSGSRGGSRGGSGGSGGSGSFITTGFKTAAQLKAPKIKGISVRKPTYKASTKKLSVSKMPKVTGVRLT